MAGPILYKKGLFWGEDVPTQLGAKVWLDGDDDSTITHDANGVSSWANKGSMVGTFDESNNSLKPAKETGYLLFTADQLTHSKNLGFSEPATVVMTVRHDNVNDLRFYQTTQSNIYSGTPRYQNINNRFEIADATNWRIYVNNFNHSTDRIVFILYGSSNTRIIVNESVDTQQNYYGFNFTNGAVRLGGLYNNSFGARFSGRYYDFQIYDKILSSSEISLLRTYLNDKHSIY
jgi:hypothetical protein